ncbi:hypothetical protein WR25_00683 [Diploscapter pachys]|uniref:Uracil-DNA glycosylase n=1 Tax=Diploscapter pachys TaxID=2018661 RepID=A0A2A2JIT7_9BILA|nr:hypothetical protein WR25_00683 [Diploscapter pachys]
MIDDSRPGGPTSDANHASEKRRKTGERKEETRPENRSLKRLSMENQPEKVKKVVIPDMFTRALKRKPADALKVTQTMGAIQKHSESTLPEKKIEGNSEGPPEKLRKMEEEVDLRVPKDVEFAFKRLLIEPKWTRVLEKEFDSNNMKNLETRLRALYKEKKIFPPKHEIFTAFHLRPFDRVKVVIIGQDPYHGDNQAHGLSFSVKKGITPPPSLKNIYKELSNDHPGFVIPEHGFLEGWAKQGVFMLNAALTVEAHKANSHADFGWHQFTDRVIKLLSEKRKNVVFLLWGRFAQDKGKFIDKSKHCIIKTNHPSPLSAHNGWFGCGCFSQANAFLKSKSIEPIDWSKL